MHHDPILGAVEFTCHEASRMVTIRTSREAVLDPIKDVDAIIRE